MPTGASGPRAPQPCWDPRAGTWWCPRAGDPSFLMGSSAPPSLALPTANPPVPLSEALLCPKDGQGKEGTGLGTPGMEEGISGEPSSKPRCPGASPGSPCRVAVARGLSQPWDTSPQPRCQHTGVTLLLPALPRDHPDSPELLPVQEKRSSSPSCLPHGRGDVTRLQPSSLSPWERVPHNYRTGEAIFASHYSQLFIFKVFQLPGSETEIVLRPAQPESYNCA